MTDNSKKRKRARGDPWSTNSETEDDGKLLFLDNSKIQH